MCESPAAPAPRELTARVSQGHARLLDLLDGLGAGELAAASGLPAWSRGHVAAHLADNARAFARQARFALRGESVEMYDGGQRGRDRSIDEGAQRPLAEQRRELEAAQRSLEEVWSRLAGGDWSRPVRFRNATVGDTALARWREAEIHAVDLDAGYRPRDWPLPFALHALDFLAARAPSSIRLALRATDTGFARTLGAGAQTPVEVSGSVRDLAAWMAGRDTDGPLHTTAAELPTLAPWPADPAD